MQIVDFLSFPLSLILFLLFLAGSYLTYGFYRRSKLLQSRALTIAFLVVVAAMMAVEGTWKLGLHREAVFLVPVFVTTYLVGMATIDAISRRLRPSFILTHLGLFLILSGGFFGAPDFESATMVLNRGGQSSYAVSEDKLTVPLDFTVALKDFRIERYGDGSSPKQFTGVLEIDGRERETSVNHPCLHHGWLIYQADYDKRDGAYSVLRLVKDPWLPFVFTGMAILALGALLGLRGTWKSWAVIPLALGLAIAFGGVSLARISFGTLMPALRSLWFVPHLIVYMLAYSLLAIALVCSFIPREKTMDLARKLLATSSALLIVGMLCGAAWAKAAWGDYWTWDAKECWAAVTWFITLIGLHLPKGKKMSIIVVILMAFLAMQVTWYGVNYLPASEYSMHTYNTE